VAEPAQRRDDNTGGKFYEHPSRTEEVPSEGGAFLVRPARYLSVTTALNIRNKEALVFWAANLAARRAMENLPQLVASTLIPSCGRTRARTEPYGCKVCVTCTQYWVAMFHHGEKSRRAREGTAAHDILEGWINTGEWAYTPQCTGDPDVDQYVPTHEAMAPYLAALQAWVADYGVERTDFLVSECTVWNHRLKYAGTLDFIVDIHPRTKKAAEFCARINYMISGNAALADPAVLQRPVRVLGDAKSSEGEEAKLYSEHPLQLVGYRNAETMTPKHGAPELEVPMIETDGACILQVRMNRETGAGEYTFRPVLTTGREMRTFEAVLVDARWEAEWGDEATLVRAFPLPTGWKYTPPTYARATTPDGKLCGCAACDNPDDADCLFAGRGSRPPGAHVREVTADGDPVPPKPVRKRAPAKKAAAKTAPKAAPADATASPLADLSRPLAKGVWQIGDEPPF
jgi:hypothetical protein